MSEIVRGHHNNERFLSPGRVAMVIASLGLVLTACAPVKPCLEATEVANRLPDALQTLAADNPTQVVQFSNLLTAEGPVKVRDCSVFKDEPTGTPTIRPPLDLPLSTPQPDDATATEQALNDAMNQLATRLFSTATAQGTPKP